MHIVFGMSLDLVRGPTCRQAGDIFCTIHQSVCNREPFGIRQMRVEAEPTGILQFGSDRIVEGDD